MPKLKKSLLERESNYFIQLKESQDEERLGGRVTEAAGKAQHVNDGIYFKLFFS